MKKIKMFGTLLATEDYALGARQLYDSLKKVNSIYKKFLILLADNINEDNIKKIFPESDILFMKIPLLNKNESIRELYTINKIYSFLIPKEFKLCLVDSDIVFIKNCDHYLDFPPGSAYPGFLSPHSANGSVIIFERDLESYQKCLNIINNFHNSKNNINDEYIWRELWKNFSEDYYKHLPIGDWYNGKEQERLIHYDGFPKPWMIN